MHRSVMMLMLLCFAGCSMPFSRPTPSAEEYRQQYLGMLSRDQVSELQFAYVGAVGGEFSIARFRTTAAGVEAIRENSDSDHLYDPKDETVRMEVKRKLVTRSGGSSLPKWFDFPFEKPLRVFREAGESSHDHPAYAHEWYVDEENLIVYYSMVWG